MTSPLQFYKPMVTPLICTCLSFGSYVVEHFLPEGQVMFVILLLLRPHDFNWSNSFVEHAIVWNIHDISILLLNRALFHVNVLRNHMLLLKG